MIHYLIFDAPVGGHSGVTLLQADSRYEALTHFLEQEYSESQFHLNEDGSVTDLTSQRHDTYPHLLAFIESDRKAWGEWQMRRLPESTWEAPYREVFCGERKPDVEYYYDLCRPVFRKEFPRSRAPAFLWYLRDGFLVTFFRPTG